MQTCTYELDENMKLVPVNMEKNTNLTPGSVVMWGGNMAWSPEKFVIFERRESSFGVTYRMIALNDFRYLTTEAHSIVRKTDKVWHSQHMFLQDEFIETSDLEELKLKAITKAKIDDETAQKKAEEREAFKNKYATPDAIKKGDILTYSFGYDMTINVFAVVLENTGKSLLCQEIAKNLNGGDFDCTAEPSSNVKEGSKPFRVFIKWFTYGEKRVYGLSGAGEHWSVYQPGEKLYENHMD